MASSSAPPANAFPRQDKTLAPGELVQIFVGQGGAQIADACWELFTQEHFITPSGEPSACLCGQEQGDCDGSAFFSLTQRGFFVPRTLIVDTEPSVLDEIRMGVYRNLFQPSSLISGCEDSASNFARGYYGAPCSLIDASYNSIRRLAEACDLLHGIIFYRTYGGGTGSGLGCTIQDDKSAFVMYKPLPGLLQYAADEFCKISRMDFGVIPGVTLSSGPVEPYNAVLATQVPVEHVNLVSLVDNMALQRICSCLLKIYKPSFTSLNRILAQCMSGLTSTFRFPGPTTITMMDLYTNLVPYPDAHFAMIGFAPLFDLETACKGQVDTTQLTESVFAPENQLVHQHEEEVNMYLTCCLFYRGNASVRDVNTCIDEMRSSNRLPFVDWCPTGFKVGISYQPMTTIEASRIGPSDTSVMALHNSTLFRTPLHELTQAVETLLKRNAFLHWYKAEGLESDEIENALGGLKKLEADYNSRDEPSYDEDANSGPFDTDLHCQRRMAPGCWATKQREEIEEDRTRNPSAKISYQNGRECYESSLREALEIIDKAYEASRCKSEMSDEEPESVIEANYDSCDTDSASQSDICRNNYKNETAPRVPKQRFCRRRSPGYSYRNDKGRHNVEVNTDETKRQNYLRQFSPTPLPEDTSSTSMNLSVPSSSLSSLSKLRNFLAVHSPKCLRKAQGSHSSSMSTTANLATSALLNEEIVRELERSVKSELSSVLDALGHVVIPPSCTPATGTNQHHHRHHHYHHHNRFKHTRS
ncbi:Tubulin alpha chain [Echinococcus granulosus]|uniref:Tubulin alpha chain n=1 Tax=Echinococcus granulosus TaxID=6210 RepID=W6U8V9_ECHGR|nr:Tubulin alpha chain [Echinococcus granulosus]EUB56931.1 Tubulin alpha chain [Echinococcus granulosus]